ncbi:hypothetical protein MAP00_003513 [Monascus purpureus]|nr:hypothetical protein MAP00_003513 [Monascus purpureus]
MDNRPASEYAQSDQASAAAAAGTQYATQPQPPPEVRPATQYTPQPEVRSAPISSSNTPQSDYGLNPPPAARSPAYPEYLARPPQYHHVPNTQAGGAAAAGMAQAANPSIAASSPTYPPPYSPYQPPGHDLAQYQGHPPPPQMYARPDWAHAYPPPHGLPGPYSAPATTVYSFVPIPGAQQHKRPRRRYEEIERMYRCGWNGCEKAYGTLNHLNAHVTMQSHGAKRTPEGMFFFFLLLLTMPTRRSGGRPDLASGPLVLHCFGAGPTVAPDGVEG